MDDQRTDPTVAEDAARARLRRVFGAATLLFGLLACATTLGPREAGVPREGWWHARGPVVPHDTFPADCGLCHAGDGWTDLVDDFEYDHALETGVALVGAHDEAECLRCHNDRGPVALYAQRGCAGCHEDVHRGQLGSDCEACHAEDASRWVVKPEIAQHDRTRFPLIGTHAAVACWRCHSGAEVGDFTGVSVECVDCHLDDLARATEPDHQAQGFVDDCQRCHLPTRWDGAGFTHTTWPLTGAHRAADCEACHVGGVYQGTPRDCVACHLTDYQGANDPDHEQLGFSTMCEQCHDTTSWEGAEFDHFGIVDGCVDCHLDDYLGTTDPDHQQLGFSQSCEQCHTTNTWEGAFFDHGGIVDGCAECHLDDYQNTTDPNHQQVGFPTTCETCHVTTMWQGATFDHDFPITTGAHRNLDCAECHTNPADYATFTCIDCHAHRQGDMADKHDEVGGYVYQSSACYMCHPNGREED